MVNVREATLEDQKEVFELLRQLMMAAADVESAIDHPSAAEAFRQIITEKKGTVLLAEEDGVTLGLVTLSYPFAIRCGGVYSCIEEFVVSERARGKGVGGMLIEAAIKKAAERGSFELQVNRPSELGYPVYLRHGWQDLGKHLNLHPVRSISRKDR
jgi:GNAT superfamily N-acetyltransferase